MMEEDRKKLEVPMMISLICPAMYRCGIPGCRYRTGRPSFPLLRP